MPCSTSRWHHSGVTRVLPPPFDIRNFEQNGIKISMIYVRVCNNIPRTARADSHSEVRFNALPAHAKLRCRRDTFV